MDLFDSDFVKMLATGLGAGIVFALRLWLKDRAAIAEKVLSVGIKVAFQVVNDRAKLTPGQVDDKVAEGLKVLSEYLASHGVTMTESMVARAKLEFSALHGEGH